MVAAAAKRFGGIDYLVNGAVTFLDNGLASTREEWLRALSVNVASGAILARMVAPVMKQHGGGAIVNFSSIAGKFANAGRILYPAAKAANRQITKNEALDLAPDRIRVNCISPAWTWSDPLRNLSGDDREAADRIGAPLHPLGRIAGPEEVAEGRGCGSARTPRRGSPAPITARSTAATRCSAPTAGAGRRECSTTPSRSGVGAAAPASCVHIESF